MATTTNQTNVFALTAAGFFLVGFVFLMTTDAGTNGSGQMGYLANLCFIGFHFALLPVIANLKAPSWAKGAGYAWIGVDNAICVMSILGAGGELTNQIRLGIHLSAATWILLASLNSSSMVVKAVGAVAAILLGGYSLVAPFVSVNVFYLAAVLLLSWCVVVGVTAKTTPTSMETPTAPTA